MSRTRPLFVYFHSFHSTNLTFNDNSKDGVLGTQTQGGRMVGADESNELWWHPYIKMLLSLVNVYFKSNEQNALLGIETNPRLLKDIWVSFNGEISKAFLTVPCYQAPAVYPLLTNWPFDLACLVSVRREWQNIARFCPFWPSGSVTTKKSLKNDSTWKMKVYDTFTKIA